jgi:hypothetical protein
MGGNLMAKFISDEEMARLEAQFPAKPSNFISDEDMAKLENESKPSELESGGWGLAQGATLGWADELESAARGMMDDAKAVFSGKEMPKAKFDSMGRVSNLDEINADVTYDKHLKESRQKYKQAEESNPGAYGTGQFFGSLLPAWAMRATGPAGLSALGAVQGWGSSEAEDLPGLARDTAKGAGTGLVAGVGGKVLSAVGSKAAPAVSRFTTNAAEEIATNPLLEKTINATNLTGRAKGLAGEMVKKMGTDLGLDSKATDYITGAIGRKAAYSTPFTGTIQGISDVARVAQKGAMITAENLPKLEPYLGKFGPLLRKAAERGGTSLAARHYVLQQTQPEYQSMIRELEGMDE